jgi:outer membrane lipoprotein-sorting protein
MDVKIKISVVLFFTSVAFVSAAEPANGKSPAVAVPSYDDLLQRAEATLANTKDYRGKIIRKERMKGKIVTQYNTFKFARPFMVYLGFIDPFEGREVIYRQGWNDNELRVHRGSFPDLTVNLDPRGSMAMKRSHHSITDFGLENTVRLMEKNLRLAQKRAEGEINVSDGGELFGQAVWKIEAKFPKGGNFVKAREDETLWDIARRSGQDMYLILTSNHDKNYDDPDDVETGDEVFVPRYYGAQAEFYMSKKTGLPIKIVTLDRNGRLYESYEYPEIELNVNLTDRDFDPKNADYNF